MKPLAPFAGWAMRLSMPCAMLPLYWSAAVPAVASAQAQRMAVVPHVSSDTVDQRLATELRDALAATSPQGTVTAKRDVEWMLTHTEGPDTLARQNLREIGKLMRADVVMGVHRCAGASTCVWVFAERLVWPSTPDTMQFRGPAWIGAATDTLALRFLRTPTGR